MEIAIGNHRLSYDGSGYQISRVANRKKSGDEFQTDYAYYATCENAARALIERMVAENLAGDAVETVRDLIDAVKQAQDMAVESTRRHVAGVLAQNADAGMVEGANGA